MIKRFGLLAAIMALISTPVLFSAPAFAQGLGGSGAATNSGGKCGNTKTEFIACDGKTGIGSINDLIKISLIVLSFIIGAVAVGALAYAGIIYASARDEQGKVTEAKTMIRNVMIGLLLYGFTVAIINWLLPGSVIDTSTPETPTGSSTSTTPPTQ